MSFTLCLGVTSMALLGTSWSRAIAQIPTAQGEKTISQVSVLFVNPSVGDDKAGNGGERAPWKTITQALQAAQPNTVIMLSPGTYSADTGEVFPLILKSGVSIQGDASNQGRGIIIAGGGEYLSRSFGGQNVTIVGANQAGLSGVTLTNTNPRGYGLWIESSNPIVQENTFTGSTQDGVSVTGNSAPIISKNYFYRNGANGITITGQSQPEVRENIFQDTGFGINIAQNAVPVVVGNQIQSNRSGIVVQANARPILRKNLIQGSKEDGLVAISQALPDLGNTSEPGSNEFRNNGRYDINASAAKQVISAPGNNLASDRVAGKVNINGFTAPIAQNLPPTPRTQETPTGGGITFAAPTISATPTKRPPGLQEIPTGGELIVSNPVISQIPNGRTVSNSRSRPLNNKVLPQLPTNVRVAAAAPTPDTLPADTAQLNYVEVDTNIIEFTAPEAPLPRETNVPKSYATGGSYGGGSLLSTRYRVVVQVATDKERALVQKLAPGAFSTVRQGRRVMQAGVFSSQSNADQMRKIFNSKGLKATVEPLN
jgi:parallel beta-helix repeat protein